MGVLYSMWKKIFPRLPLSLQFKIRNIIRNIRDNKKNYYSKSYSQCGEDMVIRHILKLQPKNKKWAWIDIGAHHPTWINNTAFFYKQGYNGINIEADPKLIKSFYALRKNDLNLNIAIADKSGEMDFYIMDSPVLNTLSAEEAYRYEKLGSKIVEIVQVRTAPITEILDNYCEGLFPDFLSLDAEGYDLMILKSINWEKSYPKVICVENIPFLPVLKNYFLSMQKNELSKYLESKNYSIIAFTLINTIFVHNDYIEKG
ncbi:MAG: FkbM family methyltransferase [Treponema sp.]|nr:FkbM family methyltransferase [Treponema sp.]